MPTRQNEIFVWDEETSKALFPLCVRRLYRNDPLQLCIAGPVPMENLADISELQGPPNEQKDQ